MSIFMSKNLNREFIFLNKNVEDILVSSDGDLNYHEAFIAGYFNDLNVEFSTNFVYLGVDGQTPRRQPFGFWAFSIDRFEIFGNIEKKLTLYCGYFAVEREPIELSKDFVFTQINKCINFIKNIGWIKVNSKSVYSKEFIEEMQFDLSKKILKNIRIVYLTNHIVSNSVFEKSQGVNLMDQGGVSVYLDIWDLDRRQKFLRNIDNYSEINFNAFTHKTMLVPSMNMGDTHGYVSVFNGQDIFNLYNSHRTNVLQSNVRVFLSATRKANKEMIKTLREEPENFFYFNNGLSITCKSIEKENNFLLGLRDVQIVNGGQTTATIHYAKLKYRDIDLRKVFVQVRIAVINNTEGIRSVVNKISLASNTQSVVSQSDFLSNSSVFLILEGFIKDYLVNNHRRDSFYFFERMKGQKSALLAQALNERQKRTLINKYPSDLTFTKIEFARWWNTYSAFPFVSASGAEKQFSFFIEKSEGALVSKKDFLIIVGFGQLFNRVRKVCGTANGTAFPSLIPDPSVGMSTSIYSTAVIHYLLGDKIEYLDLLEKKFSEDHFDELIKKYIRITWNIISEFGGTSVQEQTKKEACWLFVLDNLSRYDILLEEFEKSVFRIRSVKQLNYIFRDDLELAIAVYTYLNRNEDVRIRLGQHGKNRLILRKFESFEDLKISELVRISKDFELDLGFDEVEKLQSQNLEFYSELQIDFKTTGLLLAASIEKLAKIPL